MAVQAPRVNFMIQKILTTDISFESPNTPDIFKSKWEPTANIDLNTDNQRLDSNNYLVNLTVTVTTKSAKTTAFIAEVKQTGIFTIDCDNEEQLAPILQAYCPSILFPYSREAISGLVSRGGFPQLTLEPVNFDALHTQNQLAISEQADLKKGDHLVS